MDAREVEDIIVELLAEQAGRDPAELRRELQEEGEELPIDSLLAAEVVARVESASEFRSRPRRRRPRV
jgi:acyl carrier protein